jgi:hypothetical protein
MTRKHIDNLMSLAQVEDNPVSKEWLMEAAAELLMMEHRINRFRSCPPKSGMHYTLEQVRGILSECMGNENLTLEAEDGSEYYLSDIIRSLMLITDPVSMLKESASSR